MALYVSFVIYEQLNPQPQEFYDSLEGLRIAFSAARRNHKNAPHSDHIEYIAECGFSDVLRSPVRISQETVSRAGKGICIPDSWYELERLPHVVGQLKNAGVERIVMFDDPMVKKQQGMGVDPRMCVPHRSILSVDECPILLCSYRWFCQIMQWRYEIRQIQLNEGADTVRQRVASLAHELVASHKKWMAECGTTGDSYLAIGVQALYVKSWFEEFFAPFWKKLKDLSVLLTAGELLQRFPPQEMPELFCRSESPFPPPEQHIRVFTK